MNVVNLTPHAINILSENGEQIVNYPASGNVARCGNVNTSLGEMDGVPVITQGFGEVSGVPEPVDGTIYLVSMVVGSALKGQRDDIYGPATDPANAVRNEKGHIVGVKALVKY